MDFFVTPSWTTLSGIFFLSLLFFGAFVAIIYDQQSAGNKHAIRVITIIYVLVQIALKVFLVIGIFKITGGDTSVGWGLFIGYILTLVVDIPTILLLSMKRLSRGYGVLKEELEEEGYLSE